MGSAASTCTSSTREARGPCRSLACRALSCCSVPMARHSTVPSMLLRTHPASPSLRASLSTNQRKPTPWTRPRTIYLLAITSPVPVLISQTPSGLCNILRPTTAQQPQRGTSLPQYRSIKKTELLIGSTAVSHLRRSPAFLQNFPDLPVWANSFRPLRGLDCSPYHLSHTARVNGWQHPPEMRFG
jgi:hypothetical protein